MNTFTPMSSTVCEVGSDYFRVDFSKLKTALSPSVEIMERLTLSVFLM